MKNEFSFKSCALGIALATMTLSAFAQQTPSKPVQADPQPQQATGTSTAAQTFLGDINTTPNGFVLKDASGVSYQLDDQKTAKTFTGKSVKVTGTLDAATNTIKVASITSAL